jgi:hypothetical protein
MLDGEQVNDLCLNFIGVLILINQYVFKLFRPILADLFFLDEQAFPI